MAHTWVRQTCFSSVISLTPRADSDDMTSNVSRFPAMATLHDLDSANFFDRGSLGSRT